MSNDGITEKTVRTVDPPRIGEGVIPSVFGTISLIVGGMVSIAGGSGGVGVASFFTDLGVLLIGVAFIIGIMRKIELRLMDVQKEIIRASE